MIKQPWMGWVSGLLMGAAVLLLAVPYLAPSAVAALTGTYEPAYVAAMDKTQVLDIQIVADEADWASLLDNALAEEYIPATVIINGTKLKNVGVRPKGNSSLTMVAQDDTTDRYSFKIEFDHYVDGQTWLGLDKLVVNNMQGDATYLKEYLSYDLMAYAGVDTPLYAFSNITVNGSTWGFYLAVEALEDSYAQRVYGKDHGQLYKPESTGMGGGGAMGGGNAQLPAERFPAPAQADDQAPMGGRGNFGGGFGGDVGGFGGFGGRSGGATLQYTDDEISSYGDIFENAVFKTTDQDARRVIQALKKLNAGEDLASVVDVEATLKYFAAHTVLVNLDSYVSGMSHNYYFYEKDGRLTMLPWDYNLAFGGFQSGNASAVVNFPIDTPVSGVSLEDRPILGRLLAVPEYLELYHRYLRELMDGYFAHGQFAQMVDALDALIAPYVQADPTAFYDFAAYQKGVAALKELGALRTRSIQGQLDGSIPATTAGQSADPTALVDASTLNLSDLGSMGGGRGGMPGGAPGQDRDSSMGLGGDMGGLDPAVLEEAMAILWAAGGETLTQEQLDRLRDLGLTQEQMTRLQGGGQGGFGAGGNCPGAMGRAGEGAGPTASTGPTGLDTGGWAVLGGSTLLLLGGLLFITRYQRRRGA